MRHEHQNTIELWDGLTDKQHVTPPSTRAYTASDFEFCQDYCNVSLRDKVQSPLLPASGALRPEDPCLRVVDMRLSAEQVCVPLISPSLLCRTLALLPQPWSLKLSTDGTYRLMFDSYVLLTVGVNVKNWSLRKDISMYAFRSSFLPLAFAIANIENEHAYAHLSRTLFSAAQALGHDLRPEHILQWHGDMHRGIEAARQAVGMSDVDSLVRLGACHWAHGFCGLLSKHLPSRSPLIPHLLQFKFVESPKNAPPDCFTSCGRPYLKTSPAKATNFVQATSTPILLYEASGWRRSMGRSLAILS